MKEMKVLLLAVVMVMTSIGASAAQQKPNEPGTEDRFNFPTVAKNQSRPKPRLSSKETQYVQYYEEGCEMMGCTRVIDPCKDGTRNPDKACRRLADGTKECYGNIASVCGLYTLNTGFQLCKTCTQ